MASMTAKQPCILISKNMANVLDTDLTDNMNISTLGGSLIGNVSSGATLTDSKSRVSNIIATNVQANNGVIHAIDKVLLE